MRYAEGPPRFVPGFADLHRMTRILLAERAAPDAHVLVLGAGGGLELKALAEAEPHWRFVGVDPAAAMLTQAERTLGSLNARADPEKANGARAAVDANLSLLSPEQDARVLSEAGFRDVELFYAAFTWRGWVGYA